DPRWAACPRASAPPAGGPGTARPRFSPRLLAVGGLALWVHEPELAGNADAKLIDEHPPRDRLDLAGVQVDELKWPKRSAGEPVHRQPEAVENGAHLPILALAQANRQPDVGALDLVEGGFDRAVADACNFDPVSERVQRRLADRPVRAHAIAPEPARGRQLQMPCERAVIGQQQQALGIKVETTD